MKTLLCAMGWLVLTEVDRAAEIVAWKVPLNRYVEAGIDAAGIARCKSAPEASPFFKEGDELWDLKGVKWIGEEPVDPPVEWAIWNASSGRLVVKAEQSAIWQIHEGLRFEELPRQCRMTTELIDVPADGGPLAANAAPSRALSWVARSGQDFEVVGQGEADSMKVSGAAVFEKEFGIVDIKLHASCVMRDQSRLEIDTAFYLPSGSSMWVARDFDGSKGSDLRVSARAELMDGTPLSEAYMMQKGNIAEPVKEVDHSALQRYDVGDNGRLGITWLLPGDLACLFPNHGNAVSDGSYEGLRELLKVPRVETPADLKSWFGPTVWDLRECMKNAGVIASDSTDFAGYHRATMRAFLISKDEKALDRLEELLTPCDGCLRPLVVVTVEGKGQSRLVVRSGHKDHLTRFQGKKKVVRMLDVEATISEADDIIDLRFDHRDHTNAASGQSLVTGVILQAGVALTVLGVSVPGGKEAPVRVKAEIVRFDR